MRRPVLLAAVAIAVACGGAGPTTAPPERPTIDLIRERAEARPDDPIAWRALAEAETWMPGGETARARPAIERARSLAPGDPAVLFLAAGDHYRHARLAEAADALLAAIDAARESNDELAPAIAELALATLPGLRDDVPDIDQRTAAASERVLSAPGRLGLAARDAAAQFLISEAFRQGRPDVANGLVDRHGCVEGFRVAGPFGPLPMLRHDETLAAEGRGALRERYDLGPGRGEQAVRAARQSGCQASLGGGPVQAPGSFVAEAFVEIPTTGTWTIGFEAAGPRRLSIDGELVGEVDPRLAPAARFSFHEVELSAGRHEIELKVTARGGAPSVALVLSRAADDFSPMRGASLPEPGSPLATAVRASLADVRGDPVEARESWRRLGGPRATAAALAEQAAAMQGDPYESPSRARDEARRLYERAAALDPDAYYPALVLARMEPGPREQLGALRRVLERWPNVPLLWLELASGLAERGLTDEAEAAVDRALSILPASCAAIDARYAAEIERSHHATAAELEDELVACDARTEARYRARLAARDWPAARTELDRLTRVVIELRARALALDLAVATGDDARVEALSVELEREAPPTGAPVLRSTDAHLASGRRAAAVTELDRAISADPARMLGLSSTRRTLDPSDWLDRYRVDGAEVIRSFESAGRRYDEHGQVLVFDYMVTRIWPDGSSTDSIHQIFRVQSEESIEQLGELSLGGRVLTLRSIKPDGRRLEPDAIQGVDSIQLTNLAIGDYVEYEYVADRAPGLGGAFQSGGWVFQSFDQPFDKSQLVVLVPDGTTLVVGGGGPVPPPVETRDGDLRVVTWTVEGSRPLVAEPRFAEVPEVLPRIVLSAGASWERRFESVRDGLSGTEPRDPRAARLVARILGPRRGASVAVRTQILHAWVQKNVRPAAGFDGFAPRMLAARSGDRTRVLGYMLRLAGIPTELALVRAFGEREPGDVPETDLYGTALLRVTGERGAPFYVWAEGRHAPSSFVPAHLRGQEAVVLTPGLPREQVPDPGPSADLHRVALDIELRDGGAMVSVVETHVGASAVFWREQLAEIPEADRARSLEAGYTSRRIAGSALEAIEIEGQDEPDEPLVLRYRVSVASFGRRGTDGVHLPTLFATSLAETYATLPRRSTTERVMGANVEVTMRVTGSRSAVRGPSDERFEGPSGASFSQSSRNAGGALRVERRVVLPRQLVRAQGYVELARFCQRVDEAEGRDIVAPP